MPASMALALSADLRRRSLRRHGGSVPKQLQYYFYWPVFRSERRKSKPICLGSILLIQHAVETPPTTYFGIVRGAASGKLQTARSLKALA